MTSTTQAPAQLPLSTPSADLSLSDPSTWTAILSALAAVVADAWPSYHAQLYVAPAATLAATLVVGVTLILKHRMGQALHEMLTGTTQAAAQLPPSAQVALAGDVGTVATAAVTGLVASAPASAAAPTTITEPPLAVPGPQASS